MYEYSDLNALLNLCDDYESDFELGSNLGQHDFIPASEMTSTDNGKVFINL